MSADAEREDVRYQDVLDSLRVSYNGRAGWRDQQEKAPWKLAEREQFRNRVLGDGGGRPILAFATEHFSLVDFHVIEAGQLHFQSLTMRRAA